MRQILASARQCVWASAAAIKIATSSLVTMMAVEIRQKLNLLFEILANIYFSPKKLLIILSLACFESLVNGVTLVSCCHASRS